MMNDGLRFFALLLFLAACVRERPPDSAAVNTAVRTSDTGIVVHVDQNEYLLLEPIRLTADFTNHFPDTFRTIHPAVSHPYLMKFEASQDGNTFFLVGSNANHGIGICGNTRPDETSVWEFPHGNIVREQVWIENSFWRGEDTGPRFPVGALYLRAAFTIAGGDTTYVSDSVHVLIRAPSKPEDSAAYVFLTTDSRIPSGGGNVTSSGAVSHHLVFNSGTHQWMVPLNYFLAKHPKSRYALYIRRVSDREFGWKPLPVIPEDKLSSY